MKAESNYTKQANDFLTKTGATLTIEYKKTGKHFPEDKAERDIYLCILSRGSRSYAFDFGNSINNSGFYYTKGKRKINLDRKLINEPNLASRIKRMDYDFLNNGKSDIIHYPEAPTSYDVLAAVTKYDPETFENFCSEYGYNEDSRIAERTYNAVKEEYLALCSLFSDDELMEMSEIQ